MKRETVKGRGAGDNPHNRFETIAFERETAPEGKGLLTTLYNDVSRTILVRNDSPDVGFEYSVNPYRGCEHGCIYCYARPTHEYLGHSVGLDFETKIYVKRDAPALLRTALMRPAWTAQTIAISGVTDAYQPTERQLGITRGCLEVLREFLNPVAIITKNELVLRDRDLLAPLAEEGAAVVYLSLTTLDRKLAGMLEPRASSPEGRLRAVEGLAQAGIPVGVLIAPVIPGLTDHEIPRLLKAAAAAGASYAGFVPLRLPLGVAPLFEGWLERHFPEKREKVLNRIRAIRGGKLNDPNFGSRMRGEGVFAEQIKRLFSLSARRESLAMHGPELSAEAFRRPAEADRGPQLSLF